MHTNFFMDFAALESSRVAIKNLNFKRNIREDGPYIEEQKYLRMLVWELRKTGEKKQQLRNTSPNRADFFYPKSYFNILYPIQGTPRTK